MSAEAPILIHPISVTYLLGVRLHTLIGWRNRGLITSYLTADGERYRLSEVMDFVKPLANDAEEVWTCS